MILKRPEETVQSALEKGIPKIFDVLGPRIREQHVDKAFVNYKFQIKIVKSRIYIEQPLKIWTFLDQQEDPR